MAQSGEIESWKGFEELIGRNVRTIADYSKETREIVRNLELEIKSLKNMLVTRESEMALMKSQISNLQAKLYVGGTQ